MRVELTQGFYEARSVISDCQRCFNLYAEKNPEGWPTKFTFYNAPGLKELGTAPNMPARGLYWGNNDTLYYAAGGSFYSVSSDWVFTRIGFIDTVIGGPVSMADNGAYLVLVDGSVNGYQLEYANGGFNAISAANNSPPIGSGSVYAFYGADRIDIMDGYLVLNEPGTSNFYCTYNNEVVFDALYFAAKNGYSDNLVSLIVSRRELWLVGERTCEVWYDAGATPGVPFDIMPGPFIMHGCVAKYSLAQVDGAIFFLSQDQAGLNIMARAQNYQTERISTHAIEQEWAKYSTTADAQGFCFQVGGHTFYQINFPTADKSWRWDETTRLWHEVGWTDSNGNHHRHRAAFAVQAYGITVAADWETGQLYQIDPDLYDDAGQPMYFRRGFPHMINDGKRVIYPGFTLDVEAATTASTSPAQVLMRYSDTRGRTWSAPIARSIGAIGEYYTQPKWWRCGMGRDRVFEVFGVVPGRLAINGAFLDPQPIPLAS